jgi:hypothetical protein
MTVSRERLRDAGCVLLLVAVAVVLFADVLFAGSGFCQRDLFPYHYALKHAVRETIARGGFPFWNRFISGGQPLAANPAAELFYPPQWLLLAGPYRLEFQLHILVHVALALIGMFFFLRALRLGRSASVFGALSFGLGGFLLGAMPVLPTFFIWSWSPLCALAILRALEAPTARRIAIAGIVAAIQLIVLEPVAILQMWALIVAGALFWASATGSRAARAIGIVLLIGVFAAVLASVQVIPALDHARDSVRSRGISFRNAADFSMPPVRPLELVVPHLFGAADPARSAFWGTSLFNRGVPYFGAVFCGFAITIFMIAGLLARMRGWLFVLITAVVAYVLAIGDSSPLFRPLYDIGILRSLRYPEKFFAAAIVVMIVFAAAAADRFLHGEATRPVIAAATVIAVVNVLLAFITFTPLFPKLFSFVWGIDQIRNIVSAHTIWTTGAIIAVAWLVFLIAGRTHRPRAWLLAGLCLLLFDLGPLANDVAPRMPAAYFTPPPAERALASDDGRYSVFHRGDWMLTAERGMQMAALPGIWLTRDALEPYTPVLRNHRMALEGDWDETALLPTHDLLDGLRSLARVTPRWSSAMMTLSNVGTVIDYRKLSPGDTDPETAIPVTVAEFRWRQPRYYFATSLVPVDQFLPYLRTHPVPVATAFTPGPAEDLAPARVLASSESTNGAAIDVDASGPAFLVMTVTRHKYWHVSIDGKPVGIVAANLAYQGVRVPAGKHRVVMRYKNPLVVGSAMVSLIALGFAIVIIAPIRPRPRPRSGS